MSRVKDKDLLLVGSMPFDTAEQTFRWACDGGLAPALPCLPDGEIGERSYWIIMLGYRVYHGHPQIETLRRPNPVDGVENWKPSGRQDNWSFKVREGISAVRFGDPGWRLGYARHALNSYFVFRALREKGIVPNGMAVFNDVLVPWERVFLHGDVGRGNALFAETSIQNRTGHQTAIRGLAKCQFLTGLAVALTRTVKTDGFLHVQEQLGELLGHLQLIEGAILLSEQNTETTGHGTVRPAYAPLQALRYQIPRFYERMVQVTQVLGAGGLLINPTQADLQSTIEPDIARYERYYAGDPVRTAATLYLKHDVAPFLSRIEKTLRL